MPDSDELKTVPAIQYHTKTFEMFLKVQKNLSAGTVEKHITLANVFLEHTSCSYISLIIAHAKKVYND